LGCIAVLLIALVSPVRPAGPDKRLDRIKGAVGFSTAADGQLHEVFGHEVLPDDDFAITKSSSAAALVLPDSSIVSLGENTRVRVGAFATDSSGPGSTIAVDGGTVRFDIRRPAGGAANYHFTTVTSQVAVRGTVGLISFIAGNTTVACLACAADSVTITVGSQSLALATGQLVTISATGAIVTSTITTTALSSFSSAQVSTSAATGPSGAVSGISGASSASVSGATGSAASAAATAATTGIASSTITTVAGAAAGAAAVGVTVNAVAKPAPSPTPTQAGIGNLSSVSRSVVPPPAAPPQAMPMPTLAPPHIR
jgi:hypothetical protein